jgi:hypothetical protein
MHQNALTFVLWTAGLEETIAVIFVTELRRIGLPVKVVGLHRQPERGIFGLRLLPDLSLEQAIAFFPRVRCLIIPGPADRWALFSQHPRLGDLLKTMSAEGRLITGFSVDSTQSTSQSEAAGSLTPIIYTDLDDLILFARDLAHKLMRGDPDLKDHCSPNTFTPDHYLPQ